MIIIISSFVAFTCAPGRAAAGGRVAGFRDAAVTQTLGIKQGSAVNARPAARHACSFVLGRDAVSSFLKGYYYCRCCGVWFTRCKLR